MDLKVLATALLAALGGSACDNSTTAITPTAPIVTTTQNFADSIGVNGGETFQFSSTGRGPVTATVTTLDPDTAVIGLAIGTWNGLFCQQILAKDDATQGTQITGAVSAVGNLCLRIYDSTSKLTGPVAFSVDVSHP